MGYLTKVKFFGTKYMINKAIINPLQQKKGTEQEIIGRNILRELKIEKCKIIKPDFIQIKH